VITVTKNMILPSCEEMLGSFVLRSVDVHYGLVDNEVACVWGLIPPTLLSDTAYLWLYTNALAEQHKFILVRRSQRYIEDILKVYPRIIGDCIVGNWPARRWLTWLGAEFGPASKGRWPFVIRAKHG
jgi:hypothetical protein